MCSIFWLKCQLQRKCDRICNKVTKERGWNGKKVFFFLSKGYFHVLLHLIKAYLSPQCPETFSNIIFVCKIILNFEDKISRGIYFPVVL